MIISCLRKMKYEDRFIYVMQFGTTFQYLFAEGGDIYQHHFSYKPRIFRLILWKIGLRRTPYSPHELEQGEQIILSSAMKVIDKISDPNFKKEDPLEKQAQEAKALAREQGEDKCQWQTRENKVDGSFYWMCLTHGEVVQMEEGVAPKHK